ncbi:hypothetical protein H6G89_00750 [Oscillatoria sp. FACHB-1407]|uniref:hypothetical protein n=1 Tax=Oscillatoria sp. FACHB-1407 TaxID=2692847 RepID=UPI0016871D46|nr:hypothetical protein [Oscillatoria sp. FACHB-1407]MBD2459558.1 hypothetical protein [Oscillatoria sp. FACHB-1407]
MSSELQPQNNVEMIHQSLEEIDTLLSILEEQIRLGLFTAQPDLEIEIMTPEDQPLTLEDGAFLIDWL